MPYLALKHAHMTFVAISLSLFVFRALLNLRGVPWRNWVWLRIVPHINDTCLFLAGVWLAVIGGFQPLDHPWLAGKLVLLPLYVVAGAKALKATHRKTQFQWTIIAICIFAAMLGLAIVKPFY